MRWLTVRLTYNALSMIYSMAIHPERHHEDEHVVLIHNTVAVQIHEA